MKVLYIACNPTGSAELALEREITELQRRAIHASGEPINFIFLPSLSIEQLPMELTRHCPDVVHFSAHGDSGELLLANASNDSVKVTGEMLHEFLKYERPPKLVYFNACNSAALAKAILGVVPFAIGTTALVTNRTARASAVVFYDRILTGASIKDAFEAGRMMMEALQDKAVSSVLECVPGLDASAQRLHTVPRLVARGFPLELKFDKAGFVTVQFKLIGCPGNTSQVVFFTDDKSFVINNPKKDELDAEFLARELCQVVRDLPRRGVVQSDSTWTTYEDFRIYACGTTAGGDTFTVSSTLCDALIDYFKYVNHTEDSNALKSSLARSIAQLRDPDQARDVDLKRKDSEVSQARRSAAKAVKPVSRNVVFKKPIPDAKRTSSDEDEARSRRIKVTAQAATPAPKQVKASPRLVKSPPKGIAKPKVAAQRQARTTVRSKK